MHIKHREHMSIPCYSRLGLNHKTNWEHFSVQWVDMNCLLPSTKSTTSRCRIPGLRKVCAVSSAPMKPISNILTVVIPRHKQHLLTNKHYSFWTMSVHPSYPTCRSRSDTCDGHSQVPTQFEPLEQPSEAPSSIEKAWKQGIHKEFPAVAMEWSSLDYQCCKMPFYHPNLLHRTSCCKMWWTKHCREGLC